MEGAASWAMGWSGVDTVAFSVPLSRRSEAPLGVLLSDGWSVDMVSRSRERKLDRR